MESVGGGVDGAGGSAGGAGGAGGAEAGRSCEGSARERLLRLGATALSDPELLTLLVGAEGRAARALLAAGGLRALVEVEPNELCARPGLGAARTARLLAALELGRRVQRQAERRPRLRTPAEIDAYLRPHLGGLRREAFHVLCFNARNVLLRDARVAEGTVNACPVDPREVFGAALAARATALVLAHNHPSGDPEPSALDVALTAQLVEGARLLGMRVLDHLVVGDTGYVSFLERGLMPLAEPGPSAGGRRTWSDGP